MKKSKLVKHLFCVTVVLLVIALVAGCGSTTSTQQASSTTGAGIKGSMSEKYVMVTFLSGIPYFHGCYDGMKAAGQLLGVTTDYTGANNYDINQEVTVLNQVISEHPAGIMVTAINASALKQPIDNAISQGIPVVTFDSDSPDSSRYSFLGTSNYDAGVVAANEMAKLIGGTGDVAVLFEPGQYNLQQRGQGFIDTIKAKYPNIHVVAQGNGQVNSIKSEQVSSSILQAHSNIVGIFGTDSTAGVGIATAVKELHDVGKVHIISFDTDKATLDLIKEGTIDASLAQGTWSMGYWGLQYLFAVKHNLLHPVSDWQKANISPLPPVVDTGVSVITKDNVNFFYK